MGILITTKWWSFDHHFPPSLIYVMTLVVEHVTAIERREVGACFLYASQYRIGDCGCCQLAIVHLSVIGCPSSAPACSRSRSTAPCGSRTSREVARWIDAICTHTRLTKHSRQAPMTPPDSLTFQRKVLLSPTCRRLRF